MTLFRDQPNIDDVLKEMGQHIHDICQEIGLNSENSKSLRAHWLFLSVLNNPDAISASDNLGDKKKEAAIGLHGALETISTQLSDKDPIKKNINALKQFMKDYRDKACGGFNPDQSSQMEMKKN